MPVSMQGFESNASFAQTKGHGGMISILQMGKPRLRYSLSAYHTVEAQGLGDVRVTEGRPLLSRISLPRLPNIPKQLAFHTQIPTGQARGSAAPVLLSVPICQRDRGQGAKLSDTPFIEGSASPRGSDRGKARDHGATSSARVYRREKGTGVRAEHTQQGLRSSHDALKGQGRHSRRSLSPDQEAKRRQEFGSRSRTRGERHSRSIRLRSGGELLLCQGPGPRGRRPKTDTPALLPVTSRGP